MKAKILLIFLILLTTYSRAQRVILNDNAKNKITLDSTGYAEQHPQDISNNAGLFIYSGDGKEALRIYGSFRMLSILDNKKNFHPYDLTQPTIPTGDDDYYSPNSRWNINMSRLGFDALIGSQKLDDILIRIEFDWKGDNEKFRIRHLFIRNKNWIIGKTWSSFNNVSYLIQAVDGRFAGGAVGTRPAQVRYYNKVKNWKYQFSIENSKPSLINPIELDAKAISLIPSFATNISYEKKSFNIMISGVIRTNRVEYTIDEMNVQNLLGYGGILAFTLDLNDKNRLKSSASSGIGIGGLMGDFAFVPIDLAFNSNNQEFESVTVYTGYVGLEHDWSSQFTSSVGFGITGTKEESFYNEGSYKEGGKVLANLFFKPKRKLKHLIVGAEIEYAERINIGTSSNNTTRGSLLLIYDF